MIRCLSWFWLERCWPLTLHCEVPPFCCFLRSVVVIIPRSLFWVRSQSLVLSNLSIWVICAMFCLSLKFPSKDGGFYWAVVLSWPVWCSALTTTIVILFFCSYPVFSLFCLTWVYLIISFVRLFLVLRSFNCVVAVVLNLRYVFLYCNRSILVWTVKLLLLITFFNFAISCRYAVRW